MYHNIDANINVGVVVLFEAKFETSSGGAHDGAHPRPNQSLPFWQSNMAGRGNPL